MPHMIILLHKSVKRPTAADTIAVRGGWSTLCRQTSTPKDLPADIKARPLLVFMLHNVVTCTILLFYNVLHCCHIERNVAKLINFETSFILKFDTRFSLSILSIPVHPYSKIVQKIVQKGDMGRQVQLEHTVSVI